MKPTYILIQQTALGHMQAQVVAVKFGIVPPGVYVKPEVGVLEVLHASTWEQLQDMIHTAGWRYLREIYVPYFPAVHSARFEMKLPRKG